jgi:hypothetical protein
MNEKLEREIGFLKIYSAGITVALLLLSVLS